MQASWTSGSRARKVLGCAAAISLCGQAFCGGGGGGGGGSGGGVEPGDVALMPAFASIEFDNPVKLVQHPTDDTRWYVVEKGGEIRTFQAGNPAGTNALVVDVGNDVNFGGGNEQGLLSLAFDPDFNGTTGGEVYITYTDEDAQDSVLARYVSSDGVNFVADANPIVLAIPHPQSNHNGGDLAFGDDTFLYYSMGDGGTGQSAHAQNRNDLLGSVLRLDVRGTPPIGKTYAIPSTNPFAANGQCDDGDGANPCPEIWAFGFRNPWRMAFDPPTDDLWLGDVGEGTLEEVDRVERLGNYGWDCFEGDMVFNTSPPCDVPLTNRRDPEAVYTQTAPRAVTGGVVYRGSAIPGLVGHYLYADFYTGRIWALDTNSNADPVPLLDTSFLISAFAQARDGAVYVVTFGDPFQQVIPAP